jgi:DNA-binding NarL/FixJ family response regulator
MDKLRILLVDDHSLFRKGIAALLSARPDFQVVGEAADGLDAIARARELMPDVILMDVAMPRCTGLEAVRVIKQELPQVHIIMLTVSDDDRSVFTAIQNGASGYLLKALEPQELYDMLGKLCSGEAPISGRMAAKILQEFRQMKQNPNGHSESPDELTRREIEILELVVQGATNGEIAQALCITENTAKIHLRNILEKLHLQNRIQAAVYAVRQGLVKDPFSGT